MNFEVDNTVPTTREPVIEAVIEACENLKNGKLLTSRSLANKIKYSYPHLTTYTTHQTLTPYTIKTIHNGTRKRLWGNRNTIKAYLEYVNGEKEK